MMHEIAKNPSSYPPAMAPRMRSGSSPRRDGIGKRGVRRLEGRIPLAGEEPQEWSPLLRDMVTDCATQHRILTLERVDDRALGDRGRNLQLNLAVNARQPPQMGRQYYPNHDSVWTSTDSTAGRSRPKRPQQQCISSRWMRIPLPWLALLDRTLVPFDTLVTACKCSQPKSGRWPPAHVSVSPPLSRLPTKCGASSGSLTGCVSCR
jgi:hypothetical protein